MAEEFIEQNKVKVFEDHNDFYWAVPETKVKEFLQSQLQERDNEITRLKGLFKKCWLDSKTVEGQWCNFFANEGSKRPEYTFEKFCKENNINLTPKQE
jgi:hypothetical protein